jgi:lysophospholipase L1-like esterase
MKRITHFLFLISICVSGCTRSSCGTGNDWTHLQAGNGKPTILVIGDSISLGYFPTIYKALSANYDTIHNPGNAMCSQYTKAKIDGWLSGRDTFEAITFNNGNWDVGGHVSPAVYRNNMQYIAEKVRAHTQHPLFVLTAAIPIPYGDGAAPGMSNEQIQLLNKIATDVMQGLGIPTLDLYTPSLTLTHQDPLNIHFDEHSSEILGNLVLNQLATFGIH